MRIGGRRRAAPAPWHQVGTEPDYRFSLANERTFLAWIRTSLAMMAAAIAVAQLLPAPHLHGSRHVLALLLAAIGLLISGTAYPRWAASERAMRSDEPLPRTPIMQILAYALSIVGVIVIVVIVVG